MKDLMARILPWHRSRKPADIYFWTLPAMQRRLRAIVTAQAPDDFAWVPEWLSDPQPPTPAAEKAAQLLRKLAK